MICSSDFCVNCVSRNLLACCSLIVSAKSSLLSWVVVCHNCAVLVKSRYFSTLLSSFLMRLAVPSGSGADLCFCGSNWVTKVWLSSPFSSRSDLLSSYSIRHVSDEGSPVGIKVPSTSEGPCMCYEVIRFDGGIGGNEWGSFDEFSCPVDLRIEFPKPGVSEDYSVSSKVHD